MQILTLQKFYTPYNSREYIALGLVRISPSLTSTISYVSLLLCVPLELNTPYLFYLTKVGCNLLCLENNLANLVLSLWSRNLKEEKQLIKA